MRRSLQRYIAILRVVGILAILLVLGLVVYQLYDFYGERLGYTPVRAIQDYFAALSAGDYETIYQMTDRGRLTDIYGRPITKSEFIAQLRRLAGDEPFPFERVEAEKLCETRTHRYYRVTLYANVGGTAGRSQLFIELRKEGNSWLITYPFAIVL
ncbi:MAG: hypothetical protein H5T69_05710 [Chloroflexi bacterium]|nr:hypothetical protein [Chloroflexota bacterium]